jgi:hypothetical protein
VTTDARMDPKETDVRRPRAGPTYSQFRTRPKLTEASKSSYGGFRP